MYLKYFLAAATALIISSAAIAQEWTRTGDGDLRRDVELLKAYDIIDGPVNTWPLSWKQITTGISANEATPYPAHVMRAIERTRAKSPNREWRFSSDLRLSNEPLLVRGFGDTARSDADVTLSAGYQSSKFDGNLSVNYKDGQSDSDVTLDGSYIATNLGNWSLYGGAIDRWWGPGQDNALLFSTNARPMASIGIRRNEPKAFQTKWLSWLGPWTWDMFITRLNKNRTIPNSLMVGMRLGFEPIDNFEVGLSRNLQLCGQGRPCGFNTWTRSLIAVGDLDNTGTINEPGNQMASIDLSYSHRIGDKVLRAYITGTAEDEGLIMPYKYARLFGATLSGQYGDKGSSWNVNVEWSDSGNMTYWFFGPRNLGTTYAHSIYRTGHRYDGQSIGHSLDSGSKLISATASFQHAKGYSLALAVRTAIINWDETLYNIVSPTRQNYKSIELTAANKFYFGRLEAKMAVQTKANTLTQGLLPRFTAGLTWRKDF